MRPTTPQRRFAPRPSGFTLVEILAAAALALIIMLILTRVFGQVSASINEYRSTIEMRGQLRIASQLLQRDLNGATAVPNKPPLNPERGLGYFTIKEGPFGPIYRPEIVGSIETGRTNIRGGSDADSYVTGTPLPNMDPREVDMRLGDADDLIVFTTKHLGHDDEAGAEVAWFVRGSTLYRRVREINPSYNIRTFDLSGSLTPQLRQTLANETSYTSLRWEGGGHEARFRAPADQNIARLVPNTLSDLTKPENRMGVPARFVPGAFTHDVRFWGDLNFPTLAETTASEQNSLANWPMTVPFDGVNVPAGLTLDGNGHIRLTPNGNPFDPLLAAMPFDEIETFSGRRLDLNVNDGNDPNAAVTYRGVNSYEDIVMNNVVAFDVKVWDPNAPIYVNNFTNNQLDVNDQAFRPVGPDHPLYLTFVGGQISSFGAYVDLNYMCLLGDNAGQPNFTGPITPHFHGPGNLRSRLRGEAPNTSPGANALASVYDTWTTHYERDGVDQDGDSIVDEGTNGFDDNLQGGIDDPTEQEMPPPYAHPLRAVQITIRAFDPDFQEVREVTVTQDFVIE